MKEKSTQDLILMVVNASGDFDPINDREDFEHLITAVNAYCQIGVTNRSYEIDSHTFYALRSKLAKDLANFSDAWDHYEFQDNYEDFDAAVIDMKNSLGHMTQVKDMLNQMVEWYDSVHTELTPAAKVDYDETTQLLNDAIAEVDNLIPDKVDEPGIADGYDMTLGFD